MGDISPHFSRSEFRCHGQGKPGHDDTHDTNVDPGLLDVLENIRALTGAPLAIVSGKRCAWWNRKVKGAKLSQHLLTTAADIPPGRATARQAFDAGARGVGTKGGWAIHVDTRPGRRRNWIY